MLGLYTRYHVSFYLWLIGSLLENCYVPKYDDQDCSYSKKESKTLTKEKQEIPSSLKRKCNGSFNNICFDNLHIHISKYFKIGLLNPVEF